MIKTVLFDMDGVLFDSEPVWIRVHKKLFKKYSIPWSMNDYNRNIRGKSFEDIFKYLVRNFHLDENIKNAFVKERGALYLKFNPRMFTGVKETLHKLKKTYLVGLVTSTDRSVSETILRKNSILDMFDIIVTGDDILRGKPDPWPYQYAMSMLGSFPWETVIVEDSVIGVRAAVSSGAIVVAVTNTFPKDLLRGADFYIGDIIQLPELIRTFSRR